MRCPLDSGETQPSPSALSAAARQQVHDFATSDQPALVINKLFSLRNYPMPPGMSEEDFAQQLAIRLLEKADAYDPAKSPTLLAWATAVGRHLIIDELRRHGLSMRNADVADSDVESPEAAAIRPREFLYGNITVAKAAAIPAKKGFGEVGPADPDMLDLESIMFSKDDIETLESKYPPMHRLILLVGHACDHFVPPDLWRQWVAEAGLTAGFPGTDFWQEQNLAKRNQMMQKMTGMTVANISQIKSRGSAVLRETSIGVKLCKVYGS